MKICQVEKPLVATNRIPGLEHRHMQVVRDGSALLVAVDAVGASVMGVQPSRVKHLVLCQEKGLGTCDLSEISILGQTIEETKKEFKRSLSSRFLTHFG